MKTYKYSKILLGVGFLVTYILAIAFLFFLNILRKEPIEFDKSYFAATAAYILCIAMGIGEYSHRAVTFDDDVIKLYSVRAQSFKVGLKAMDYRINYENIFRISADKLPLIGIYRVKIYGKNLPAAIHINCFFCKRKELFANFYHICRLKNSNIKFDKCLVEFAERRVNNETKK
ncbi:MAG: hypothetical protein IJN93_07840 [Clostridia bacterium]|nr:hypothetical protein [Clostridia bacterium]